MGLARLRARSGMGTGRSEAGQVTVMVEEPRVTGCSCRWFPAPSLPQFPMCTMQGDFKALLPPHVLESGVREGFQMGDPGF